MLNFFTYVFDFFNLIVLGAGVAFTKHLIHLYTYQGSSELGQHLEVCFVLFYATFSMRHLLGPYIDI